MFDLTELTAHRRNLHPKPAYPRIETPGNLAPRCMELQARAEPIHRVAHNQRRRGETSVHWQRQSAAAAGQPQLHAGWPTQCLHSCGPAPARHIQAATLHKGCVCRQWSRAAHATDVVAVLTLSCGAGSPSVHVCLDLFWLVHSCLRRLAMRTKLRDIDHRSWHGAVARAAATCTSGRIRSFRLLVHLPGANALACDA